MKFSLPKNIRSIISIINKNGYSAHVVGGCVRDTLIGKIPVDWDITTDAAPDVVKTLFQKTYETGIKHGTITVSYGGSLVEVTTWRTETQYSDHRRPDHIDFATSLMEDLSRRDFTINSLAYHPDDGLIDPFNGLKDIKLRIIRCVGDPISRFSEDALRMLRAVRFSALLGFKIEEKTLTAIQTLWEDLAYVSMERIQTEVNKILESDCPERMVLLWETGLHKIIFPSIEALPSAWIQLTTKLKGVQNKKVFLLSLLFYTTFGINPAKEARRLLNRLRYDNSTLHGVMKLIQCIQEFGTFSDRNIRKMVSEYGEETAKNAMLGIGQLNGSYHDSSDTRLHLTLMPTKPVLSGFNLKNTEIFQGKDIKTMLSVLSLCIYEQPELNDADTLMRLAREIINLPVWEKVSP